MKKTPFIVIEGGEGAGKGTQIKNLREWLGDDVVTTREPGGTPYAEEIRNVILKSSHAGEADANTLFALFWAARADHLRHLIVPSLRGHKVVVSDRFDASTFAYQIYGQGHAHLKEFFWMMRETYLGDTKPDVYIYLDVDVKTGLARKVSQGADENNHFEARAIEFHTRMREGYMEFFKHVPHRVIDANQSPDKVWQDLQKVIADYL